MAFIVKTAKTIRNNWKKSLFGAIVVAYGTKFARDKYNEELIRRAFCEEAQKYGNRILTPEDNNPRRVTVFLNPAVQGGKGTKLFTKNAAPILYLAGMEVNVVKTEYEGQVKEFIKVLEAHDTDAIIIAGGDGTLLEAVTGFMRKENPNFRNTIPIGIIPIGKTNRFAQLLFGTDLKQVRMIAEAAMTVIRGETQLVDVMKIEGKEGKATYAVSGLETGLFRDAEQRKLKNWYFGPLKHYWTYVRSTLNNDWPAVLTGRLQYVEATEQNTQLVAPSVEEKPKPKSTWRWLLSFLYNQSPKPPATVDLVMRDTEDKEEEMDLSTTEFTIMSSNFHSKNSIPSLDVSIGPADPAKTEFISDGWRRVKERNNNSNNSLLLGSPDNKHLQVKSLHFQPNEEACEGQWFNIDGEMFEAMPITVSLLRNKLRIYKPQSPVLVT